MSSRTHHTQHRPQEQDLSQISDHHWQELVALLPADANARAVELKAFERARGLACPTDVLRGLLAYAFCFGSFREVGAWAQSTGLSTNGERSWAKRCRQAADWLLWLVQALLTPIEQQEPLHLPASFAGRVHLVDATHIRSWKRTGESRRLHCSYDLLNQRLSQLLLTDHHVGEGLRHFQFQPGDIVVGDSAYCRRQAILEHLDRGVQVLVRLHWTNTPLVQADASPFDLSAWLSSLQERGQGEEVVFIQVRGRLVRLRLVAHRLSEAAAKRAHSKRKRKASKNGCRNQALTIQIADWLVVLTSLAQEQWSLQDVLSLYRARWQVELLFKRIKQLLRLHRLRSAHLQSNQAVLAAMLIGWLLLEQQASLLRSELSQQQACANRPISPWALCALLTQSLRSMLLGVWSWSQVRASLLQRPTLVTVRRQHRTHQASEVVEQLIPILSQGLQRSLS